MNVLVRAAERHRAEFRRFVERAGVLIDVVFPSAKPAPLTQAEKVTGAKPRGDESGEVHQVRVIWSSDLSSPTNVDGDIVSVAQALGHNPDKPIDAVIRLNLADGLEDVSRPLGQTIFDTAKEVVFLGERFVVSGSKRTGMPPIGPYILWVGLRRSWRV